VTSVRGTAKARRQRPDWYSISVDSLRAWTTFFFIIAALVGGFFGYRAWERGVLERETASAIAEARELLEKLGAHQGMAEYRSEYSAAQDDYKKAVEHQRRGETQPALDRANASRNLLSWVMEQLNQDGPKGEAVFILVQGEVQFRRGETGDWKPARMRVALVNGDYVRTGPSSSAQIMSPSGTLYTVQPDSLVIISRGRLAGNGAEQSIAMEYGWVDLSTKRTASNVTTPTAEATVRRESEASVSYDANSRISRFVSYRGRISVSDGDGSERDVGPQEEVVKVGEDLGSTRRLPDRPALVSPADKQQVSFGAVQRLELKWEPVAGAAGYALQVSRNRLFGDNVIDVTNRRRNSATLGLQGEGTFEWRVAAVGRDGVKGPWSTARQFRVASFGNGGEGDSTPPELKLEEVSSHGSIFIVAGSTEPGAEVTINGEPVPVNADGSFTKTVQLNSEGWSFVDILARDTWGNEAKLSRRVFVESF
jgi:hypothetical protein